MKKCYIAGMISGLPIEIAQANFLGAKYEVADMGYEPISPMDLPHNHNKTWEEHMREDIRAMLMCDAVYCLSGWTYSPGARMEIEIAGKLGLQLIQQGSDFKRRINVIREIIKTDPEVWAVESRKMVKVFSETRARDAVYYRCTICLWIYESNKLPLGWHDELAELLGRDRTQIYHYLKTAKKLEKNKEFNSQKNLLLSKLSEFESKKVDFTTHHIIQPFVTF